MRRFLLFLIAPLFLFLFANVQPASAVTCYTLSGSFEVKNTCGETGSSGCASYNPIVGETPCCTAGGYQTCKKDEICTPGGCQNLTNSSV